MSYLENFPNKERLLGALDEERNGFPMKINGHVHSPYSFSAFESIAEMVRLAALEDVMVLGINDFYVRDGFGEFMTRCMDHGVFPLLNIELIGISKEDQQAGIRVNDPNNPGRTYVSGKGLAYPSELPPSMEERLSSVVKESDRQVSQMVDLLNEWLEKQEVPFSLSVEEIMKKLAHGLLRERHVAKMVRLKLEEHAGSDKEFYAMIEKVYGGEPATRKRSDIPGTEDEIRSRLLKSGAPAFVPEDDRAFLPLDEIIKLIRVAGGIPTYPLLLDGAGGKITEFEEGKEQLLEELDSRGFNSIEFIPLRNKFEKLKEYAEFFYDNGFVISFGTEHNTSALGPVAVSCKDGVELDDSLTEISFNGAAYVAAHQYLVAKEGPGYQPCSRDQMERLGKAIFQYYFETYNPSFAK
ncbi:MAG: hypothetical protein ABFS10_05030 [Bacteroidota bacterium]